MWTKEFNLESLDYEATLLTTHPWHSTRYYPIIWKWICYCLRTFVLDFVHCLSLLNQHVSEIGALPVVKWTGYEGKPILLGPPKGILNTKHYRQKAFKLKNFLG
jgi:hypothetical protein